MEREGQELKVGKSILVPSVQELAKDPLLVGVPDKYVRSGLLPHSPISSEIQVPVISLEAIVNGDENELLRFDSACRLWGFFQLTNHGVSSELVESFKANTQAFFKILMEEKKKYWQTTTDVEGFGQAFVQSEEQKLDWADMFFLTTLPFRDTLESYSSKLEELALKIMECMSKALKIDSEVIRSMFGEGQQFMRMNYYPPCPEPNKVIGLTPHSDSVALTILVQVNDMEGLQVM